jgi:signal transduction histidine kinase
MRLVDFIRDERSAIVARAVERVHEQVPNNPENGLATHLYRFVDEVIAALERDGRLPPHLQSATQRIATAADLGEEQKRLGVPIEDIPLIFGAVSDQVGELAGAGNLSFDAREYRVFNQCLDSAVAGALERYSQDGAHAPSGTERLGFLAHELRNHLATAQMAFSMLKTGYVGIQSQTGAMVERSLARMAALVKQSLVAAELEAGVKAELEPLRVADLFNDIQAAAVVERGVTVVTECDDDLELCADSRMLSSAVTNLVQNGIKFTRAGGTVTVRARAVGDRVYIEVEDECGGLPPGKENELFQPFVRGTRDHRGAGLGLAITREAVRAHEGELTVRDLPGKGCIFAVVLPRAGASVACA